MKKDFQKELSALSSEQLAAVNSIYGPVLLVAGPGSGKTRVLTMRIANIIEQTDTSAKSILAITFTENAAAEMRERLADLIGSLAYEVQIKTFHQFANGIIQEYPEKFITADKLEPIDDLTRIQLIKNIVNKVKPRLYYSFARPNESLSKIGSLISAIKKEGYSAKKFAEAVEEAIKNPDEDKLYKRGDKKGQLKSDAIKEQKKWQELADLFTKYEQEMQKRGFYDFEDMILFVLNQLDQDENLLFDLQEKHLFFLIDEFQDTNGAQLQLIHKIAEAEKPNIFAVGDADQSIYRFQGASMENILNFQEYFSDAKTLFLSTNYRSSAEIVELGQNLIEQNTERVQKMLNLPEQKMLSYKGKNEINTVLNEFATEDEEKANTLKWIQKLNLEGRPFSEMAIIFRTNKEGENWLKYLERNRIPAVFESRSDALASVAVQQFLNLLELIENPEDNRNYFKILHFNFLKISEKEIWQTWQKLKENKQNFWQYFLENEENGLIKSFNNKLVQWQKDQFNLNFPDFLRKIFSESGLMNYLIEENNLKIQDLNNLSTIFTEAERLTFKDKNTGIKEFLEIITLRDDFNLPLSKRDFFTKKDAVRLITAHKAKGLEYPVVFIPSLYQGNWDNRRNKSIKLPIPLKSQENENNLEEERRLFYVAMTRAKERLFLSFFEQDIEGKQKNKSRFLEELLENENNPLTIYKEEKDSTGIKERVKNKLLYAEKDYHQESLEIVRENLNPEKFALSHTVYENYQKCPRKTFYDNVLCIPRKMPYQLILGTGVHRGLEVFFRSLQHNKQEPEIKIALDALESQIQKEFADIADKENAIIEGKEILENYLTAKKGTFKEPAELELNFRPHKVVVGTAHLTGKVDKVEFIDKATNRVRIIDYKTSTPSAEKAIKGENDGQKNDLRAGENYRQLLFFAILAENSDSYKYQTNHFEIHYLRPRESGTYAEVAFDLPENEIEAHKAEIMEVWEKMQNMEFPKVAETRKQEICEKLGEQGKRCPYYEICWQEE